MKSVELKSRRRLTDPDYVKNGDEVLTATFQPDGRLSIALALGSGDYLDGMCAISIELTPTQRKRLKGIL